MQCTAGRAQQCADITERVCGPGAGAEQGAELGVGLGQEAGLVAGQGVSPECGKCYLVQREVCRPVHTHCSEGGCSGEVCQMLLEKAGQYVTYSVTTLKLDML